MIKGSEKNRGSRRARKTANGRRKWDEERKTREILRESRASGRNRTSVDTGEIRVLARDRVFSGESKSRLLSHRGATRARGEHTARAALYRGGIFTEGKRRGEEARGSLLAAIPPKRETRFRKRSDSARIGSDAAERSPRMRHHSRWAARGSSLISARGTSSSPRVRGGVMHFVSPLPFTMYTLLRCVGEKKRDGDFSGKGVGSGEERKVPNRSGLGVSITPPLQVANEFIVL